MEKEKVSFDPVKPIVRPDKNFLIKRKRYPIDFGLIKKYSNYFYHNRKSYKGVNDIELQINDFEITEESIHAFISCCQNQPFDITNSTVFLLHKLSIQYEVPELSKLTDEYIQKNHKQLIFQIISENQNLKVNFDLSEEEEIIVAHFFEYVNEEQLISLPINVLYRIVNKLKLKKMDSQSRNQFIEFLFKCLDKHKRKASVLFTNLDLEYVNVNLITRLLSNYNEVFDFGMINPEFMVKTFSDLLNDLSKLKMENSITFSEMQSEIQKQKALLDSYQQFSNELKSSFEDQLKKLQQEISDQKKSQIDQQNEYENKLIELETKINEQAKIIEKFNLSLVSKISIITENDFFSVGVPITLTAKVEPLNAFNRGVEWKIMQPNEGIIEVIKENERKLVIKGLIPVKKVKITAKSLDGSCIEATKELTVINLIKCELNVSVQSDQTIKGSIKIEKIQIIDKEKSRYMLSTDSSPSLGINSYKFGSKIENSNQNVSFMKGKGTYYLHVLVVDIYGNPNEFVSDALHTNGIFFVFDYTGNVQTVELEKGDYKLEVWGAQGATAFYGSSSYIRTGGKGGYSVGTISLTSKTKLYVYVGGKGVPKKSGGKVEGGFNGGGYNADTRDDYEKGVGGGGTDIRVNTDSLYARVIVAGGGGGGNGSTGGGGSTGGAGGGMNGGVGVRQNNSDEHKKANASAGTQISGGKPGEGVGRQFTQSGIIIATGIFGNGGSVTSETYKTMAGAGGGGWYGGGAGNGYGGGGAGGSGWVFTESNYNQWKSGNSSDATQYLLDSSFYLKNAQTISGDNKFEDTSGTGKETGHCGNGFAKITPQ